MISHSNFTQVFLGILLTKYLDTTRWRYANKILIYIIKKSNVDLILVDNKPEKKIKLFFVNHNLKYLNIEKLNIKKFNSISLNFSFTFDQKDPAIIFLLQVLQVCLKV